jgi:beta-lactamase class D
VTFYFLAIVFVMTLMFSLSLLIGLVFRPPFWRKHIYKIQILYAVWFVPYAIFFFFFTGPVDLGIYPPAESSPYRLPWRAGVSRFVSQGNRSFNSHRAKHFYAWDFVMPLGAEIVAARAGKVIKIEQSFSGVGLNSNFLWIQHEDGQISNYGHIQKDGALVKEGDVVQSGQPIALNGMVGETSLPHVHFVVFNRDGTESIPISFNDVPGGVPFAGRFYVSGNDRRIDFKKLFGEREGCFVLKRLSTGQTVESHNPIRCSKRLSPNSTFKIPAALMAFESGIFNSIDQRIKWDGKKNFREEENRDQTPLTWMDQSVVWTTQWIMQQMKPAVMQKFLNEFQYGNRDFSGGTASAWLDSSLEISADEQVQFLTRFWQETLPLSALTIQNTKKILFIKKLGSNHELFGKTGTGCASGDCRAKGVLQRGWFVGVVKTTNDAYVFAANSEDLMPQSGYAGPRLRKDITSAIEEMQLK